jgi:glycosyltransferase involved in cell wall biosynthesis
MKKLCFVVHRYAPFPGGSETYVQQMAEECFNRGYDVTVIAAKHRGDLNGVKVTSKRSVLLEPFDLIIVHSANVNIQEKVLAMAKNIKNPILFLIIDPIESFIGLRALNNVKYIGCSSEHDWDFVRKWNVENKAYKVIHGISPKDSIGTKGLFKDKFNIPKNKRMFLSCGGYWPNKRMKELSIAFSQANLDDAILVLTGYDNSDNLMPQSSENVISLMVEDPKDVKNAIADADCYIMNSSSEGFGLVILESMINKTPWISRNIAGAKLLSKYGTVYDTEEELTEILKIWRNRNVDAGYEHVMNYHLIKNTIDDIEDILKTE